MASQDPVLERLVDINRSFAAKLQELEIAASEREAALRAAAEQAEVEIGQIREHGAGLEMEIVRLTAAIGDAQQHTQAALADAEAAHGRAEAINAQATARHARLIDEHTAANALATAEIRRLQETLAGAAEREKAGKDALRREIERFAAQTLVHEQQLTVANDELRRSAVDLAAMSARCAAAEEARKAADRSVKRLEVALENAERARAGGLREIDALCRRTAAAEQDRDGLVATLATARAELVQKEERHATIRSRLEKLNRSILSDYQSVKLERDDLRHRGQEPLDDIRHEEAQRVNARLDSMEERLAKALRPDEPLNESLPDMALLPANAAGSSAARNPAAEEMTLAQLLKKSDHGFLDNSYHLLLHRPPDPDGFAFFFHELQRGEDRIRVLAHIAMSPEGQAINAQIPGLGEAIEALMAPSEAVPLTSRPNPLEELPVTLSGSGHPSEGQSPFGNGKSVVMTLEELLGYHDESFVRHAYRLLLRREPDPEGFKHYVGLLRRGESRIAVLGDLSSSGEGRIIDANLPGLRECVRGHRRRSFYSFRRIAAWLFGPDPEGDVLQHVRAIENQTARMLALAERGGMVPTHMPPVARQVMDPPPAALVPPPATAAVEPSAAAPFETVSTVDTASLPSLPSLPAAGPASIALDARRGMPVEQWGAAARGLLQYLWPPRTPEIDEAGGRLIIVIFGDAPSARTLESLQAFRQAAAFDVDFVGLGVTVPQGASVDSIEHLSARVAPGDLVLMLGATDELDAMLAPILVAETAWKRDFILPDQAFVEDGRINLIPFHGIDPLHLRHGDYISSRYLLSGRALKAVIARKPASICALAQDVLAEYAEKPGAFLHLPFPFIVNGTLGEKVLRTRRLALVDELVQARPSLGSDLDGSISAIICTKDSGYLLDALVSQLLEMPRIKEVVIVSNNTSSSYALDLLDRLSQHSRCKVLAYNKPFNFSEQNNIGAAAASGDFFLIMNDDINPIGRDWLDVMLESVVSDLDRIVGPLLLYPDQTIQHGGMYMGFNNCAGHAFRHLTHPHDAAMFELVAPRRVTSLTGACLLMKRSVFERLNGFDVLLATMLQDVDLSLRAFHSGVELVFDPRAILFHLESVSIKKTLTDEAVLRRREREYAHFRARWHSEIWTDPYHNRGLDLQDEALRTLRVAL